MHRCVFHQSQQLQFYCNIICLLSAAACSRENLRTLDTTTASLKENGRFVQAAAASSMEMCLISPTTNRGNCRRSEGLAHYNTQ